MEQVESCSRRLLGTLPSSEMRSTAFHFQPGDVLYGRLRPYLNKVLCADIEGLCSSEFIVLPPQPSFEPKYLAFYLSTDGFVSFANQLNQGDRPRVSFDQIAEYEIPLPPLPEQRRIVAKLETLLGKVDACQQRLAKIPVLLKRFRQSVLAAACSGRLTADWREEHDDVESAIQLLRSFGAKPLAESDDGIPGTWCWGKCGELVTNHDRQRIPVKQSDRDNRSGPYPYYGAFGIIDDIDEYLYTGNYLLLAEDGKNLESRCDGQHSSSNRSAPRATGSCEAGGWVVCAGRPA